MIWVLEDAGMKRFFIPHAENLPFSSTVMICILMIRYCRALWNAFYEQNCAMLVGTYRMVNFNLEEIPPGIIDHKEWTPENGRNNALRINGLGAPRAFYTPVIRNIRVPNVSYGEDYAVGLNISRYYQIGRIYEPLYLCRRWEENSDASLDVEKMNTHNFYKDKIRTIEFRARQQYVQEGQEV